MISKKRVAKVTDAIMLGATYAVIGMCASFVLFLFFFVAVFMFPQGTILVGIIFLGVLIAALNSWAKS